jgi:hypothetical protein
MPTALRSGPYRFFFYSSDGHEPPHIHVARDDAVAKFWLDPLRHDHSLGFRPAELRRIGEYYCGATGSLVESVV